MFGIGMPELIVVGAIGIMFFGVGKLPEVGSSLGKAIQNFRRASDGKEQIDLNQKS